MERIIYELKYVGINFLILILGYIYLYNPASHLRDDFQNKYGEGIKASNILNQSYQEEGKEHIQLYMWSIAVFLIVIIIAVAMIYCVDRFIFAYIQIIISLLFIIFALFSMINAYIITLVLGGLIFLLIGIAINSSSNNR